MIGQRGYHKLPCLHPCLQAKGEGGHVPAEGDRLRAPSSFQLFVAMWESSSLFPVLLTFKETLENQNCVCNVLILKGRKPIHVILINIFRVNQIMYVGGLFANKTTEDDLGWGALSGQ